MGIIALNLGLIMTDENKQLLIFLLSRSVLASDSGYGHSVIASTSGVGQTNQGIRGTSGLINSQDADEMRGMEKRRD